MHLYEVYLYMVGNDWRNWVWLLSMGIHDFGEICVRRTFVTNRRVGKDTVTTRRVGKDYCALRSSCRSRPSAKTCQWFEREISWGIYRAQVFEWISDHWSWIAQHYSLESSCWGILLGGSMLEWSGMEWLHWMEWRDGWLTHLSSVSLTTMRAWAWFFRLVHGWSSEQIFFFTMWWNVFCGSCWFFCKDVNSTARLQKFFHFMVSDIICLLHMFHQRVSNLGHFLCSSKVSCFRNSRGRHGWLTGGSIKFTHSCFDGRNFISTWRLEFSIFVQFSH